MPRDTAWIEDVAFGHVNLSTEELRQVDFAEAGLCDLPHIEPKPPLVPMFGDIDKLHLLLKVACDDFASILRDPRYRIAVSTAWHEPSDAAFFKRCNICVAGAVIAKSFNRPRHQNLGPWSFGSEVAKRLEAIGDLKEGRVSQAYRIMADDFDGEVPWEVSDLTIRWTKRLESVCDASNRITGYVLLRELYELQAELKDADL